MEQTLTAMTTPVSTGVWDGLRSRWQQFRIWRHTAPYTLTATQRLKLALVKMRVANGTAYLDVAYPGWEQKVDVSWLNIGSSRACIIGQLYGSYAWAPLEATAPQGHGAPVRGFMFYDVMDVHRLNACWRSEILRRRFAA